MLVLLALCWSCFSFWIQCSNGAKIWSGESSITALQGTKATFTWNLSLTETDANLVWQTVQIVIVDGLSAPELVSFFKAGGKSVHDPNYQGRASDLTSNITRVGTVVTIRFTIANLTTTDERAYRPIVGFDRGFSSYPSATRLVIQVKVHNFEGPQNLTKTELEQLNLTCSADGKPPPQLTLVLPNGEQINGVDSLAVLRTAYRNMTGMYNCTAENNVTAPQTKSAFLTVLYPPECNISVYPNKVIKPNAMIVNCNPSYGEPRQLNATLLYPLGRFHRRVLNVTNTNQSYDGWYNCTVDNGIGTPGMCSERVTVWYKPEFSSPPIATPSEVCLHQSISLECKADGNPDITNYTFYDGNKYLGFSTNGSFQTTSHTVGRRNFSCIAKNSEGRGLASVQVKVIESPKFGNCSIDGIVRKDATVIEGKNIILRCDIFGDRPNVTLWMDGRVMVMGINGTYRFTPVNRKDNGTYRMVVSNRCNTTEETLRLTVHFPASCAFPQDMLNVNEGKTATLNISTTGNPPVNNYIWTHPNGSRLFGNNTLRFIALREDSGWYNCSVYNGIGVRGNCTLYVNVKYSATCEIYPNISNVIVNENDQGSLTCKSDGNPEATDLIWTYPNGSSLPGSSTLHFTASRNDVKQYHCSVSNGVGGRGNCSRNVTVYYSPRSVNVGCGKNDNLTLECRENISSVHHSPVCVRSETNDLTLSCFAEASPLPIYYWTYGSAKDVHISNRSSLWLRNVEKTHSGLYTCSVSNSIGKANATTFVRVLYKPQPFNITRYPAEAYEFGNITLHCNATADPEPTITWYFKGGTLKNETNKVLVLSNITLSSSGPYMCKARNCLGSASSNSTLQVNYSPRSVTITPYGDDCCVRNQSSNVTLNCSAEGFPNPEYQWTFTGYNEHVSNLTSDPLLTITNIKIEESGIYTCTASNKLGVSTAKKSINVLHKPMQMRITRQPEEAIESGTITLTCENSAYPTPQYQWYFNGSLLKNNASKKNLVLEKITLYDAGNYTCFAWNYLGNATNSTYVVVKYKPRQILITRQPEEAIESGNITLTCETTANPPPEYQWHFNGKRLDNRIDRILVLENIMVNYTGEYLCFARNKFGNATNSTSLVVKYGPTTSRMHCPRYLDINEGRNGTLFCNATTFPSSNISFFRNNVVLKSTVYTATFEFVSITYNASVVTCKAVNDIGSAQCNTTLLVARREDCHIIINKEWNEDYNDANSVLYKELELSIRQELQKVYKGTTWKSVEVENFSRGSVVANLIMYFGGNDASLQPLIDAVEKGMNISGSNVSSVNPGFKRPTTAPSTAPSTAPTTPSTTPTQEPQVDLPMIAVVSVVAVVVVLLLVVILCYCKKKRSSDYDKDDQIIALEQSAEKNGRTYSPSAYADHGPHTNPAFDSEDGPKSDVKININQPTSTAGELQHEESAYAVLNKTKKTRKADKNNPEELTYAELGEFQTTRSQAKGGILLQPLRKSDHTKMPAPYDETLYAEIVGIKKQGSDNQCVETTVDDSLNKLTNDEIDKEQQKVDPTKQNEQKAAVEKKDSVSAPDNPQEQFSTKEDSGKVESRSEKNPEEAIPKLSGETSHPTKKNEQKAAVTENDPVRAPDDPQQQPPTKEDSADSFLVSGRHDTTLTTVSL